MSTSPTYPPYPSDVSDEEWAFVAPYLALVSDYERLSQVLAGLHFVAFACLLLHRVVPLMSSS